MQQLVCRLLLCLLIIQLICLYLLHNQYQLVLINSTYVVTRSKTRGARRMTERGRVSVELFMKYPTVDEVIQNLKTQPSDVCRDIWELGNGRKMCMDVGLISARNHCIVYSFGSSNTNLSVEKALATRCSVHVFNPYVKLDQVPNTSDIRLYPYGLGTEGESRDRYGKRLSSYSSVLSRLEHYQRNIDYVFLDLQGSEAKILKEIIRQGHLRYIKQLSITFSLKSLQQTRRSYKDIDYIINEIEERRMTRYSAASLAPSHSFLPVLKRSEHTVYVLSWFNVVFRKPYSGRC